MKDDYNQAHEDGRYTKMITLDVGKRFYVENGNWHGEIVLIDGVKCIKNIYHTFVIKEDYELLLA